MTIAFRMVNFTIKGITRAACMVDDAELVKIPMTIDPGGQSCEFSGRTDFYNSSATQECHCSSQRRNLELHGCSFNLWGGIPIN